MRFAFVPLLLLTGMAVCAQERAPTYTGQVADILERRCSGCHNRGGVGRLALDSYQQAHAFMHEIVNTANNRQMPPLFAVPGFGTFSNESGLTLEEIDTLIRWTEAGAPLGPGTAKTGRNWAPTKWSGGKPDLVLTTPAARIAANGPREVRCFVLPSRLRTAKAVRSIDVLPGDRRVVYQVRVFAVQSAAVGAADCRHSESGRIQVGEWTPNFGSIPTPQGVGRPLAANAALLVEVSYQTAGLAATDTSRVGIYFEPAARLVRTQVVQEYGVEIPAGEWNAVAKASWIAGGDMTVLAIAPHMHRLGMEMQVIATRPGATPETVLWVRDFDENRQKAYTFSEPQFWPAGTRVELIGSFNNSDSNSRLPQGPKVAARDTLTAFIEFVDGRL